MSHTRIDELRGLYDYDRWANARVLDAAAALDAEALGRDLGSSYPSVKDTLVHILAAEWVWLERWLGRSPAGLPAWELATLNDVRARWAGIEAAQRELLDGLTDDDVDRVVAYRNTRGDPFESTMGEMLRHVVNHSSYHRGQVITMLRQLGAPTVSTDLIEYYRARRGASTPSGAGGAGAAPHPPGR